MVYTGRVDRQKLEMMMMGSAGWLNRGGIMIHICLFSESILLHCPVFKIRIRSDPYHLVGSGSTSKWSGSETLHLFLHLFSGEYIFITVLFSGGLLSPSF